MWECVCLTLLVSEAYVWDWETMFAAERKEAHMGVCVVSLQKENRGHIRGPNTGKRILNRTNGSTKPARGKYASAGWNSAIWSGAWGKLACFKENWLLRKSVWIGGIPKYSEFFEIRKLLYFWPLYKYQGPVVDKWPLQLCLWFCTCSLTFVVQDFTHLMVNVKY